MQERTTGRADETSSGGHVLQIVWYYNQLDYLSMILIKHTYKFEASSLIVSGPSVDDVDVESKAVQRPVSEPSSEART